MSDRAETAASIRRLLETEGEVIGSRVREFNRGRYESVAALDDYEALRDRARAIKEDAVERLPDLIDQVTAAVEHRGGTVYLAADAADARSYVASVCDATDAETVVKSKSMTTEEIELNDAIATPDRTVWETDLGEFVVQLADEAPSHLVGPALHKSREDIAALFNEHFDPDPPLETAEELTRFAREFLGERIREADVGITGANAVAADAGAVAVVTSEGNARKTVTATDTHVAVAGVEKLVPTVEDVSPFLELVARSCTGQEITPYVSLFSPGTATPTLDFGTDETGPADDREFHLVLLDNGRMEMREDEALRETLYCIRCGACANSCANFQHVGGHAFGGETYTGGIATGWEAGVHGLDSAAEFNDLCTGCSRCAEACPVKIDIPWINTVVRDRVNRGADRDAFDFLVEGLTPDAEPGGLDVQKRLFGNVETLAKLGSATAPVSNWLADLAPVRAALERVAGVDRRRELPAFHHETLRDWFGERGSRVDPAAADLSVVLYPDVYTNYVRPERGRGAVRVLESLGCHVRVPAVPESGRAPLSQGMVETARRQARDVHAALVEHVDAGRDVVVVEPSDLAMFRREYEKLLPGPSADRLGGASYEVLEYVHGLLSNGGDAGALASAGAVDYHPHCQQRTLGLTGHTVAVLEAAGADVRTSEAECCGMAGSFGYKRQYYELSADVGASLAAEFDADDRTVVASGTSCLDQLADLLDRDPVHPVALLDPARRE